MRPKAIQVSAPALYQSLFGGFCHPIAAFSRTPLFAAYHNAIRIVRVWLEPCQPGMVGSRRLGEGNKLSRRIKNLDSSRSIGFRPCPDSFAAGRVDMLEIPVVYELPV